MKFLLTNDDGINAHGIISLREIVEDLGEVNTIAPKTEKSASGHGITMHYPLYAKTFNYNDNSKGWAVDGTPADCVKLALTTILKEDRPDICLSGINRGANLGTDVLYSGTVSAAIEAALLGVPAVAISLADPNPQSYTNAAAFIKELIDKSLSNNLPPDTLLNVNIPNVPTDKIKGVKVTRLGERKYANVYEERKDPRGNVYYWLTGDVDESNPHPESDVYAVKHNYISITPIHFDLTNHYLIDKVSAWNWN
ncbi:5'-nucleotidase [Desulfitispora alkaliphila]|uniref:5'/3'-nucleotidase SurE n=1 Tax=Desulfitispora alkaliphila TaxID=622674 RepID=UPI003D1FC99F